MSKFTAYLLANDAKWMMTDLELPFAPFPGMDLNGLADEQSLKVSGVGYDVKTKIFKLRVSWLSQEPLTSTQLIDLNVGWTLAK